MRVVGNRKHGYPRNEMGLRSEMGADRYDVILGGVEEARRMPQAGGKAELTRVGSHKPQPNGSHLSSHLRGVSTNLRARFACLVRGQ